MEPVSVLASLGSMGGELPPTYVVGCEPANVQDGMGLTPAVEAAVDPAIDAVLRVLNGELTRPATSATKERS
jgi:hydrogenase maturation protease